MKKAILGFSCADGVKPLDKMFTVRCDNCAGDMWLPVIPKRCVKICTRCAYAFGITEEEILQANDGGTT